MKAMVMNIAPGTTYMILSPPDARVPAGLEHIALDSAGVEMVTRYHIPWAFPNEPYLRDPDGNWVEFSASITDRSAVPGVTKPQLPGNPAIKLPVFESVAIQRIAIKVSDLARAVEFYRHFGAEKGAAGSKNTRSLDFRGTTLELVASRDAPGLESFTVGVRNFKPAAARKALHQLGVKASWKHQGGVGFHDPDGNRVEVVSA